MQLDAEVERSVATTRYADLNHLADRILGEPFHVVVSDEPLDQEWLVGITNNFASRRVEVARQIVTSAGPSAFENDGFIAQVNRRINLGRHAVVVCDEIAQGLSIPITELPQWDRSFLDPK